MNRERGSFGHRYWSSLTDVRYAAGATRERNWRGQPFWRRFLASFFVLPQPPRPRRKPVETARMAQTRYVLQPQPPQVQQQPWQPPQVQQQPWQPPQPQPQPQPQQPWQPQPWQPQRARRPWLLRYQSAVLAGAAVLTGVVVVTMRHQGGGPGNGGTTTPTSIGSPSSPSTSEAVWQGTMRVDAGGEEVTSGPPPSATTVFGLSLSGTSTLIGSGNLAPLEQDTTLDVFDCSSVLQAGVVSVLTVHPGDEFCMAAEDGSVALAQVTAEAAPSPDGPYVDLDVTVRP
ncbi:hypothetical protein KGQ20_08855 [Catenulispora sp. NF23]|uniref:hypothetical protein n=1 Tax=Catenulispora pinistramenti TaxID=2705254 RepID=UPI001BAD511E|nr:hypothetical protein [Catenulispora pinistramenti]MBS2532882.1 hypothetical protein [Catenulispora pinistramenti]